MGWRNRMRSQDPTRMRSQNPTTTNNITSVNIMPFDRPRCGHFTRIISSIHDCIRFFQSQAYPTPHWLPILLPCTIPRHRSICGGSHRVTTVLFSLLTQYPRTGHVRAPPGHRALAGQHSHSLPSPYAHGADCARAGSRQLRGSVTNGMMPFIAFAH